jgi:hypothetical protein
VCLWGSFVGLLEAASVFVGAICWAVGGSKCAFWGHLLGCWRQQVCLWVPFDGLLEAASMRVGVICWAVEGGKCACGGHFTADILEVALP